MSDIDGHVVLASRLVSMNSDATELMRYMSELSERAYCAGWMEGLEYTLWKAVLEGRLKYGRLQITRRIPQS